MTRRFRDSGASGFAAGNSCRSRSHAGCCRAQTGSCRRSKQAAGDRDRTVTRWLFSPSAAAIVLVAAIFLFVRRHRTPLTPAAAPPRRLPAVSRQLWRHSLPSRLCRAEIVSDAGTGKVTFDDQPPAEFQDGQWTLDKIPAGRTQAKFDEPAR